MRCRYEAGAPEAGSIVCFAGAGGKRRAPAGGSADAFCPLRPSNAHRNGAARRWFYPPLFMMYTRRIFFRKGRVDLWHKLPL